MGIPLRTLVTVCLLILAPMASAIDRAVCRNEATVLRALTAEVTRLEKVQQTLNQLANDTLPSGVDVASLFDEKNALFARSNSLRKDTEWPGQLSCVELQEEYQAQLKDLGWLQQDLSKRRDRWLQMSSGLRRALAELSHSRQELRSLYDELQQALNAAGYEVDLADTPVGAVQAQQRIMRLKILRLLTRLTENATEDSISELISLYQYAIENPLVIGQFDASQIAQLPDNVTELGLHYLAKARLDALNLRYLLNSIRAWVWQEHTGLFLDTVLERGGLQQLLLIETHALQFRLYELQEDISLEVETRSRSTHPTRELITATLSYLLGGVALLALALISRKLAEFLLRLNEQISRQLKGRRTLTNLHRVVHGLAVLAPWVVGWVGVILLTNAYIEYHVYFLLITIPFARMYIFYGVCKLVGEWLQVRIAQQAGVYLSNEQSQSLTRNVRLSAINMVLPLLAMDLIATIIGPSLLLLISLLVVIAALYFSSSLLLSRRRSDLIAAVQSVLPESLDATAERLLSGILFWIFAPLQLLVLLPGFAAAFFHRLLIDFDWYRKISARWFKMRVGTQEDDSEESRQIVEDYRSWFIRDDNDLPYIESGLYTALRKPLDRWLNEKSDENALLVTGERGIGKSRSLHKLKKVLQEENAQLKVIYANVPAKTCAPEQVLTLVGDCLQTDLSEGPGALVHADESREPTVIMLDNAQNFFLSRVGSLQGWQTLLSLTNTRISNVYWIISINNQSWAYLSNVFGRDYQFRNVLRAKPWTQNDIRSLILSRNHLSGFKLQYDEVLLSTRGPEAGNIRNAEQRYFSLLWDACHGNPMLALRLWLTSIRTAGETVTAGLPAEPGSISADKLGGNSLFVYAAIATHENLTTSEIVAATSLPESVVRFALKTAFDAGFLMRSEDGRYRLVPQWYHTITNLLARKNLLNE